MRHTLNLKSIDRVKQSLRWIRLLPRSITRRTRTPFEKEEDRGIRRSTRDAIVDRRQIQLIPIPDDPTPTPEEYIKFLRGLREAILSNPSLKEIKRTDLSNAEHIRATLGRLASLERFANHMDPDDLKKLEQDLVRLFPKSVKKKGS